MTSGQVRQHDPAPDPAGPSPAGEQEPRALSREIVALAAVVVLGSIMTVLDATIVNVALPTLGHDFRAPVASIQWVPSIYLLTFAAVIPASAWAAERFGARRVWLASLTAFLAGSLACGLAGSLAELIGFRVLQGLGGGMILPVGQAILARAAGPRRMGRVMSIVGVPLLLGPVAGPVIGGVIVGSASWRWIFFVNLPVGAAALALAAWLLPATQGRRGAKLDVPGLILLSAGLGGSLYGLDRLGTGAGGDMPLIAVVGGLALTCAFAVYALKAPRPLLDLRLFGRRGFAAASLAA